MTKTPFSLAGLLALGPAAASAAELTPRDIYRHYSRGVVLLMAVGRDGTGELGTGSVVDDSGGRILTNAHVVIRRSTRRPYETIRVYFKPRRITGDPKKDLRNPYRGRVVAFDRALDLAIVELEDKPADIRAIPIGDADRVEPGEPVIAIGHPEQGGLWTLTTGVVSTVKADLGGVAGKDVFQTDASINRGNSGGPLLDMRGAMIGVNTSMARKARDGLAITSVNFAVKSSVVKDWIAKAAVDVDYYEAEETAYPAAAKPKKRLPDARIPAGEMPVAVDPSVKPRRIPKPPKKPVKKAGKPARPKARILTPKKPFRIGDLIEREIAAMEDLEGEMLREIEKRRGRFKKGD